MPRTRPPYPPEFRQHIIEMVARHPPTTGLAEPHAVALSVVPQATRPESPTRVRRHRARIVWHAAAATARNGLADAPGRASPSPVVAELERRCA
ncbi:MAG: hypothetical protein IRZ00_17320 [Gemmatimonadetes bacterium]|nr:hypothetical protein [Gemmatimonadota bacterium]